MFRIKLYFMQLAVCKAVEVAASVLRRTSDVIFTVKSALKRPARAGRHIMVT